tara:strand:- start:1032 stop:1268 length:237 start_codon:yes stop_codon:yes gene_type:complete
MKKQVNIPLDVFVERYLWTTKAQEGEDDWQGYRLSDSEEALRQLKGLIHSIITGSDSYTFESFKSDIEQIEKEIEEDL